MSTVDAILMKHGLPTYGTEDDKKARAIRNGLLQDVNTKPTPSVETKEEKKEEPKNEAPHRGRRKGK